MPASTLRMMPNRYSRPITAPLSRPNASSSRLSPQASQLSGRVNRWVTRNALLYFGSRNEVGRLINVKSGSANFSTASSSDCDAAAGVWAAAGAAVSFLSLSVFGSFWACDRTGAPTTSAAARAAARPVKERVTSAPLEEVPSIARGANRDPAFQDQNLPVAEVWTVERHASTGNAGPSFHLLHDVAVFGIAWDDANCPRFAAARHVHPIVVGHIVIEVLAACWIATRARVAVHARGPSRGVGLFDDLALNARER